MQKRAINSIFSEMENHSEQDSWKERKEHFYRINACDKETGYALTRDITVKSSEYLRGITREQAVKMKGKTKSSSVYEVFVTIKRIS